MSRVEWIILVLIDIDGNMLKGYDGMGMDGICYLHMRI